MITWIFQHCAGWRLVETPHSLFRLAWLGCFARRISDPLTSWIGATHCQLPGCTIHCVPALHFSARGIYDRNMTLWCGYVIESQERRVYFAGDTAFGDHFAQIREKFGSPRLALLPIGAYEPRWFMSPVHMGPDEAVRAHEILGAETSIAIHHGTFQLADEGIDTPKKQLIACARNRLVSGPQQRPICRHSMTIDKHTLALISIVGSSLDVLGALYLAYDLLGGEHGPLRTLTRAVTYGAFFGIGYGLFLGPVFGLTSGVAHGITLAWEYSRASGAGRSRDSGWIRR